MSLIITRTQVSIKRLPDFSMGASVWDRTVCAEPLPTSRVQSQFNDAIKFSEGGLSAYHVPSNTGHWGRGNTLVGAALFARGPARAEDERDAQRPHLLCPALWEAQGARKAEETRLGLGTFYGFPEGQKQSLPRTPQCTRQILPHI